jgi:hypothetical protein
MAPAGQQPQSKHDLDAADDRDGHGRLDERHDRRDQPGRQRGHTGDLQCTEPDEGHGQGDAQGEWGDPAQGREAGAPRSVRRAL